MGVKFVGGGEVGVAYHSAENLGVDAGFGGLGDEGMAAVMGGVGRGSQFFHELLPFPFGEIGVGMVGAFAAVYELWVALGGGKEIAVGFLAQLGDRYDTIFASVGFPPMK